MPNNFSGSAFASNFMTGFSFVDEIKNRKKADARLEQALATEREERSFQRRRTIEADKQVRENRGFAQLERDHTAETRQRDRTREVRGREANKILALGPDADSADLQEFADFPEVRDALRARGFDAQAQRDQETVFGSQGQAIPGEQAPETQATDAGFAAEFQPTQPPSDELAVQRRLTDDEINVIADEDPAQARRIRDQQNERAVGGFSADAGKSGTLTALQAENLQKHSKKKDVTTQWDQFADVANTSGDALRDLDPSILTAKYFDERSNISDPNIQRNADVRMRPAIIETIETQTQARLVAEPGSREFRNASRKLSEAYGLANEIGFTFSPAEAAGVTGGGLPINRNPQLTANVVEATQTGPGTPLPGNPTQQRMDQTIVQRGTSGRRLNKKQLDAAYRMYKGGRLPLTSYQTYLNTGQLPTGTKTTVEQVDPKLDTVVFVRDAAGNVISRKVIEQARDPSKSGRNVVEGDALANLNFMAKAYNTGDNKTLGTDTLGGFLSALERNEAVARNAGYDYSNINDVASLHQRYMDLYVLRDAYDDEWFFNGDFNPEFSQDIGDIAQALFSQKPDAAIASGEFEDSNNDTISEITPLKPSRQLATEEIRNIQANVPELTNASPEEVQAAYDAQQSGR